jgi:MoaA/NifB/PqqE/SkfB family radical SAM enzyme
MANLTVGFLSQLILRGELFGNAARNAVEATAATLQRRTDPVMLQLEVTSRCNFRCRYCIVHNGSGSDAHRDMDMAVFREALDRFPKSFYVQLQGQGEPLLNRNLVEMLHVLDAQRRFTGIVTNGSLWTENRSREILQAGADVIAFSLDLCPPERMERMRVGMSVAKVEENLVRLLRLRDELRPATAVGVSSVLLKDIYEDPEALEEAVRRIDELGVDFIVVDPLAGTTCYRTRYPDGLGTHRIEPPSPRRLIPFRTRAAVYEAPDLNSIAGRCMWPWMGVYVNYDGTIALCANNHRVSVGHLSDPELANLAGHVKLREGFRTGQVPDACQGCQYLLAFRR